MALLKGSIHPAGNVQPLVVHQHGDGYILRIYSCTKELRFFFSIKIY